MSTSFIVEAQTLGKQVSRPVPGEAATLIILDDISFGIEAGTTVAILGASGSGKSTLLGLLAGLDTPSHGRVRLAGQDLGALDEDGRARWRAGRVGFVFQAFHLLPGLTALENVMLPLELAAQFTTEPSEPADCPASALSPRAQAETLLERVGLAARATHYPRQLSGGEQQRCALARAFAGRPQVLFADEPTGNLDARTGSRIIDLLFELNRTEGTTLVMATHDAELAARCDRRLELEAGRLCGDHARPEPDMVSNISPSNDRQRGSHRGGHREEQ